MTAINSKWQGRLLTFSAIAISTIWLLTHNVTFTADSATYFQYAPLCLAGHHAKTALTADEATLTSMPGFSSSTHQRPYWSGSWRWSWNYRRSSH